MSAPKREDTIVSTGTSTSFGTFLKTIAEPRIPDPDTLIAKILAELTSGEKAAAELIDVAGGSLSRLEETMMRLIRLGFVSENRTTEGVAYRLTKQGEAAAAKHK